MLKYDFLLGKTLCFCIVFFCSCASDVYESEINQHKDRITTAINVKEVKATGNSETRKSFPYAIYVYVRQQEGNKNASVSYDVGVTTKALGDNAPFFQWGRKDPFVPSTGLGDEGKKVSTYYALAGDINTTEIANTIKNPYSFNSSSGNASNELWNVGSINTNGAKSLIPVIKSIYDPSPIGFHVPSSGTFLGLGSNGRSSWQNTSGKKGRNIYPFISGVGSTVFFSCKRSI